MGLHCEMQIFKKQLLHCSTTHGDLFVATLLHESTSASNLAAASLAFPFASNEGCSLLMEFLVWYAMSNWCTSLQQAASFLSWNRYWLPAHLEGQVANPAGFLLQLTSAMFSMTAGTFGQESSARSTSQHECQWLSNTMEGSRGLVHRTVASSGWVSVLPLHTLPLLW